LLLMGAFFVIRLVWQQRQYERAYEGLQPGTGKLEVLSLFGRPSSIESCNLNASWDGTPLPAGQEQCVEEFRYVSWVSPEQWVIGFDRRGKAIIKDYLSSP